MEAMAIGHAVPIYKRDRSLSTTTTKRPLLKPPKKVNAKKDSQKKGRFKKKKKKSSSAIESDTDQDTDVPNGLPLNWPPPPPTPADNEAQVPVSETASTITLPRVTPPAPRSPDRPSTSRSQKSTMTRRTSFTTPLPSRGRQKRHTSTESLSDTPFTDLVNSINSSTTTTSKSQTSAAALVPDRAHQHRAGLKRTSTETTKTEGSKTSSAPSSTRSSRPNPPPPSPSTAKSPPLSASATGRDFRAYLQHATSTPNVNAYGQSAERERADVHGISGQGLRPVITVDTFRSPHAIPYLHGSSERGSPLTPAPAVMSMMPPAPNQAYPPPPSASVGGGAREFNPQATYQHIQEMASKRVSTLDYLRKTHEGRVYWYNTLLFSRPDILKLPSFSPIRLARRATNFLLLGLSLPAILDPNSTSPLDYLRALNALLSEFEAYQQIHPPDGSGSSSLSRARIPRFFSGKGAGGLVGGSGGKGRRSSSAADIGAPLVPTDSLGSNNSANGPAAPAPSGTNAFASSEQELLPGEEYAHLLTPSLPFDPDFFEVFATLCDVLIDTYMRISALVNSPDRVGPGVAEVFAKADARMRKIIVSGVVKEFEDATRAGVKGEVAGVGRVVLGGLM